MDEPTFDATGYPTDETLEAIEHWPVHSAADYEAVMDFVGRAWRWPDMWERTDNYRDPEDVRRSATAYQPRPVLRYTFSTGGWSGNESLVAAIERNTIVQAIGAWSWRRGGHYEYRFPVG